MKRYTFEVVITEGSDEFWESIAFSSGCEEVTAELKSALNSYGFVDDNTSITLVEYLFSG